MTVIDYRNKVLPEDGYKYVIRNRQFRLKVNQAEEQHFAKVFGHSRFCWNKILEQAKEQYTNYLKNPVNNPKPQMSSYDLSKELTKLKQDNMWLYEVSKGPLQEAIHKLGSAFSNFFKKKTKHPKFKNKHGNQTAYYPDGSFTIKEGLIYLSKLDTPLKLKGVRDIPTYPIGCTITKTVTGKYFVTLTLTVPAVRKAGKGTIGIDLGLSNYITLSDGTTIPNPKHFIVLQRQLARAQRKLSKAKPGSNNRSKIKLIVAKLHERITNARKDFLHKLSSLIVLDNQAIVMEALNVVGLLKNHRLAKHIADAGWGMFKRMIEYKIQETNNGILLVANTFFPSTQLCSTCGHKPEVKLKLSDREWVCPICHSHHNRDINAAVNLKQLGEKMLKLIEAGFAIQGKQFYTSKDFGTLLH